jgi:hypothetical protein
MAREGITIMARFERDKYTEERGVDLARSYAGETRDEHGRLMSLSQLHRADPSWFPPPWVLINWRETIPRFRLLMEQAERTRAFVMMEEAIEIADDTTRQAAQARNAMDARMRMAEAIDRRRFGKGQAGEPIENESPSDALAAMSREQLLAVAQGGLAGGAGPVGLALASEREPGSNPVGGGGG